MPTSPLYRIEAVISGTPGAPFYSRILMSTSVGTPAQASAAWRTFWVDASGFIANNLSVQVTDTVYTLDGATGQITAATSVPTTAAVGGSASDPQLPYANQGMIRWATGVYRNGREVAGRTYVPGLTNAANNDGVISTTYRVGVTAAAATLRAKGVAVYSPTAQQWYSPITNAIPAKIAVLRSRRD